MQHPDDDKRWDLQCNINCKNIIMKRLENVWKTCKNVYKNAFFGIHYIYILQDFVPL
jgi:hypothetical protein